jgi:hypothetical protein
MFKESENAVLETEAMIDPEKIWGNDEEEWAGWREAKRDKMPADYAAAQAKEITGERTRNAYEKVFGKMTKTPSEDMLADFFVKRGGSIYFKRRNLQYQQKISFENIRDYYENERWKEELLKLPMYQL